MAPRSPESSAVRALGPQLRLLRSAAGLSQEQLGERASVTSASVSRIERGKNHPSGALLGRLADALGVSLDELRKPPRKRPVPALSRPAIAKLVATVEPLSDAEIDNVTKGVVLLMAVGRRTAR